MGFISALISPVGSVQNICLGHPHKNQTELHGEFVLHDFLLCGSVGTPFKKKTTKNRGPPSCQSFESKEIKDIM